MFINIVPLKFGAPVITYAFNKKSSSQVPTIRVGILLGLSV